MRHPTAIIHPNAKLADDVSIGPYTVIGEHVEIGAGTVIGPHVVIEGHTAIGEQNKISQFCSLGAVPQDKKYAGEPTRLEIGNYNTIREFCSFNVGTIQDGGVTKIGNHNWIMAYVHLAHDCQLGDHIIMANSAQLAGHVEVDDYAILGAFTIAHQFVKLGAHCFTGMGTVLLQDVPAYVTVSGSTPKPYSINVEGPKRRGFSKEAIRAIRQAYKTLYKSGLSFEAAQAEIAKQVQNCPELELMRDFLAKSTRGITR